MAAHASFTAADNAAANHTYTRVNIDGSTVRYEERTGSSSLGWKACTVVLRPPVPGNGAKVYRVTTRFTYPVVVDEVVNGVTVPKVIRTYVREITDTLPADGLQSERDFFEVLSRNALGTATVKDATTNLLPLNGP